MALSIFDEHFLKDTLDSVKQSPDKTDKPQVIVVQHGSQNDATATEYRLVVSQLIDAMTAINKPVDIIATIERDESGKMISISIKDRT